MNQIKESFAESSRTSQYEGGVAPNYDFNGEEDDFGMESDAYDPRRGNIHGIGPSANSMVSSY